MNRSTNKNHIVHHTRTTGPCKLHIYPCKKPYNQRHEPILRSEIHKTWAEYRIIGLDQKSNAAPLHGPWLSDTIRSDIVPEIPIKPVLFRPSSFKTQMHGSTLSSGTGAPTKPSVTALISPDKKSYSGATDNTPTNNKLPESAGNTPR